MGFGVFLQSHKNPCSVAALLCGNFGSLMDFVEIFTLFCWQNSIKIYTNMSENFHRNMKLWWKISTKNCFFGIFPQNFAFLASFHTNSLFWTISTELCFFAKLPQQFALTENLHKKFTLLKFFLLNHFLEIFKNNLLCGKKSTGICFKIFTKCMFKETLFSLLLHKIVLFYY